MQSHRFPVLVWQDVAGRFTAALVEENLAAEGPTRRAALDGLHDFLRWRYAETDEFTPPDFHDPRLISFSVPVRPEYRTKVRIFPCNDLVGFLVHCVYGRQEGGLHVASLPLLGIRFYYYEADSLRELANRYAEERVQGLTPRQISRLLPPPQVWLDDLVVRLFRTRSRRDEPELPALSAVAEPIGHRALRKQFGPAWERDAELAELAGRLRKATGHVLLVGETGVGKTTLVAAAAALLERERREKKKTDQAESTPQAHRFWITSGGRLIAGMKYLGQWQERCEELIGELGAIDGILCVENLLDLVRTGGREPGASVAAFLETYLQRGELRMIAEVTPAELDACRRLLPGLADLFQIVTIPEFDRTRALRVLERLAAQWKQNQRLEFERGVLELVYRLFRRFHPYQSFPGRVVAFLSQLAEETARRAAAAGPETPIVARQRDAVALFVRQTGLPELFLRDELPLAHEDVLCEFEKRIIGQPAACRAAANLVTTFKAGLNDPARPVAVLLFCGPTGVGKTELARAIARYFFGHGDESQRLVRLDMSEYGSFDAARRLVETPAGEPSELIKRVRAQPFSVVLLDEIEKGAPEVFDMLLGLFDEGRLTDRYGRVTSFRSAIVILTSNLGSQQQSSIGFQPERGTPFESAVQAFFRPEFYNRLDAVVVFRSLARETIVAITRKELDDVSRREGLAANRIRVAWSDAVVDRLAAAGFDPRYGARPLQRMLERLVVAPLARFLLDHPGVTDRTLLADLDAKGAVVCAWQ